MSDIWYWFFSMQLRMFFFFAAKPKHSVVLFTLGIPSLGGWRYPKSLSQPGEDSGLRHQIHTWGLEIL